MDTLLTLLGAAGVTFVMGVPGADDIMLNYQSTSFHDALYLREALGLKRAPEFEAWLDKHRHRRWQRSAAADARRSSVARRRRMKPPARDPWHALTRYTPARIALGRCGASLPTEELLRFGVAHAQARDAVHLPFDAAALARDLQSLGFDTVEVTSAAADRATYLRRPDLGRRLDDASRRRLSAAARGDDAMRLAFVVGDGLSAAAVHAHAAPLLREAAAARSKPTSRSRRWCLRTRRAWRSATRSAPRLPRRRWRC